MADIFDLKKALRTQYADLTAVEADAGTNQATAVQICTTRKDYKINYIHNGLNVDVVIWLVHPDLDAAVADNRVMMLEVAAGAAINNQFHPVGTVLPTKTKILVSKVSGTASSGKIRMFLAE